MGHVLAPTTMSVAADEVAKHATETDCWCIIGDDVHGVTNFLKDHPGGKKAIMLFAGKDATEEFDMLHDRKVIKKYGLSQGTVIAKGSCKNEDHNHRSFVVSRDSSRTARNSYTPIC